MLLPFGYVFMYEFFDMIKDDIYFMKKALSCAKAAAAAGEIPIGAVIVKDGEIISTGRNMREKKKNALLHAEMIAIDRACKKLDSWRLNDCTIYVTLEPCPMCAGAIVNARISRVVFGCRDSKAGSFGSVIDLADCNLNHNYEVKSGVLENECASLLSDFFVSLRKRPKGTKR